VTRRGRFRWNHKSRLDALSEHARRANRSRQARTAPNLEEIYLKQDLPRDIGRVLGGKKLENEGRVQQRAMPLQLQQSAIVVVRDLANVKWASHRRKTRRVAQQAQRASKIMFQCGWSAASPDFSI
jgi:hypothetical protein